MSMKTGSHEIARNRARPRSPGRGALRLRQSAPPAKRMEGLSYQEVSALLRDIRLEQGVVARAVEFIVLTACHVSEACPAVWSEFDFQARVWTIAAQRSKSRRVHRIPLSDEAIAVLEQVWGCDPTWVFPGTGNAKFDYPALRRLLQRLGYPAFAMRASRTTFRSWAAEQPQHCEDAVALCLGHAWEPKERLIAARLPDRCHALMEDWGRWCEAGQRRE